MLGVWQNEQPTELNRDLPLEIEVAPPGVVVEGMGGASSRMNCANPSTSLSTPEPAAAKLVMSSGYPTFSRFRQLVTRPPGCVCSSSGKGRSWVNSSLA